MISAFGIDHGHVSKANDGLHYLKYGRAMGASTSKIAGAWKKTSYKRDTPRAIRRDDAKDSRDIQGVKEKAFGAQGNAAAPKGMTVSAYVFPRQNLHSWRPF